MYKRGIKGGGEEKEGEAEGMQQMYIKEIRRGKALGDPLVGRAIGGSNQ